MRLWLIAALVMAVAATSAPLDAQAKRLAGGKSTGLQRNMPARTAPDAPPAKPATPAQQAAPANAATPPAAPAATPPKRNWMGPLAGLAAGLGIAALLSHFGMGGAAASFMMMALLAVAGVALVMFLLRRFSGARAPAMAGAGGMPTAGGAQVAWPQPTPATAPATPMTLDAPVNPAALAAPVADTPTGVFVPAAFDAEGFARTAKMIFIRLQAANDTADLDDLRRFTTPEFFASALLDIQERGPAAQHTDVVKVDADVLDVASETDRQIVSVRFHGQVVEEKGAAPVDFDEVWHLVKPHDDSRSWAIAGIEQMA
jgi:predicted lipid-binding transport protein (Tim44 family)